MDSGDARIPIDTTDHGDVISLPDRPVDRGGPTPACVTLPAPYNSELPRVTASGATATAIAKALEAILAAQTPPLSPGKMYVLPAADCRNVVNRDNSPSTFRCDLLIQIDGAAPVKASTDGKAANLATDLFNALKLAGGTECIDPHGTFLNTKNMTVSAGAAQYDDASNHRPILTPNVVVNGTTADSAVQAIAAAGLNDCDPTRSIYFVCTRFGSAPECSYQWFPYEQVGSSVLVATCGPGTGLPLPGAMIKAAAGLAIWQSLLAAAKSAGFQPENGTLEQTTVLNAREFSWDGQRLGFTLLTGNVNGPPTPSGMGAGPADEP